jgi:hypothetical protein
MAEFLSALTGEIAELEAELKTDPRFAKLQKLREILSLYSSDNGVVGKGAEGQQRTVTRVPSEARAKALELADMFLRNRTTPTPTREILDYIVSNGGEIGGQEPVSNLSAMLSNSETFQSNGRAGWTLKSANFNRLAPEAASAIAAEMVGMYSNGEILEAWNWLETHNKIPQEMDARALHEGRTFLGRHLTDEEMRLLRQALAAAIGGAAQKQKF